MAFTRGRGAFAVAEVNEPQRVQEAAAKVFNAQRELGEAARLLDADPTTPHSKDATALKDWAGYLLRDLTEFTCE